MEIKKTYITAPKRTLKMEWKLEDIQSLRIGDYEEPKIDISKLSVEEQQDLIVKKLKAPPKKPRSREEELHDLMSEIMAQSIQNEIDAEIVKSLQNLKKEDEE